MNLKSLEAFHVLGFRKGEAATHETLGLIARAQGDLDAAAALLAQAVALSAAEQLPWLEAGALQCLAELELDRARPREAAELAQRSLRLHVVIESRTGVLYSLGYLAEAAARSGNPTRASLLWKAIEAEEGLHGRAISETDRKRWAAEIASLGRNSRAVGSGQGQPLPLMHAIEEALAPETRVSA